MADVTIGRSVPLEPGQRPKDLSLSVALASDHPPVATFDAFAGSTEIDKDLLGNPRFGTPQLLFASVRRYGIDSKLWAQRVDSNTQGKISFDSAKSAARLTIQNGNFDRTYSSLQTKTNFAYQPGRSMDCSYGVQCSRGAANDNVVIEFGAFDNFDGYGFRILREGGKDKLFVFRRTSSGETGGLTQRDSIPYLNGHNDLMDANAYEQIIEVGNSTASGYSEPTNGNRLDGSLDGAVDVNGNLTSTGHKLSLFDEDLSATNLTMFRIRYSWYGASGADFWAFVPLDKTPKPGIPRWVRVQSIPIGDNLQFPLLKNPDKPLTFRIYRRADSTGAGTIPSTSAFLSTFGTSFSIDAGDPKPMEIYSESSGSLTLNSANSTPALAIQIKPYITSSAETVTGVSADTPNQLRAFPLTLSINSSSPCSFSLVKNPVVTGATFPLPVAGDLSAVAKASVPGTITPNTGKVVSTFYTGQEDGQSIKLDEIFAYNREYLAREAQTTAGVAGDSLYVVAKSLTPTLLINSITSTGTVATATVTNGHSLKTGSVVTIAGATPSGYNGTFTVDALNATQFTYAVASGLASPATGSISADLNVRASASLVWGQQ
ncbi:hypothetical protein [Anabaena catenula]|uniref:Uncharacterized protein n=1 Tax=Anabaena catenula FACHB-362 TaxID=2692877 RepID=A0ABR8JA56_9NOST|nr:hypothetical protein [Anabaena catenula]MBD2694443.1 hypothetical protein [Anabaena catenula FACHB-362]